VTETSALITAFVTLFVVIDPVALVPVFIALTRGSSDPLRRRIAMRACLMAIFLLMLFGLFGDAVLNFIGISMPAFRIAGGILLFLTALDMLFERRTKRRKGQAQEAEDDADHDDPSVFPLGVPLIAGPGSMATMVLLAGAPGVTWPEALAIHAIMVVVVGITFVCLLGAGLMERALGPVGINVVTRLLGMLLAALSVQFVLDGLRTFEMTLS